jgi:hypothetical protein
MSDSHQATSQTLPPHVQLVNMGRAFIVSKVVYAAAQLGLADELAEGPQSAAELADRLKVHAPSLHRLMRTLASLGILTEQSAQRFALTALGEALKTGAFGAARSSLLWFGGPWVSGAWGHLMHSLETGKSGMEKASGLALFDYLAQHPEHGSLFSQMLMGLHNGEPPAVADAYNFSAFGTIVDVGGGNGNVLAAILSRHPAPRGVLFDRPHVVSEAPALLTATGVNERVTLMAGDFFQTVPAGGDAYVLSHIIHDWTEDQCLTILGHCRKALRPNGRLLIIEMVLPPGDAPHPGKLLDMTMLVMTDGQERTEAEYAALLDKAGFRLSRVVPTTSAASVVEAVPA